MSCYVKKLKGYFFRAKLVYAVRYNKKKLFEKLAKKYKNLRTFDLDKLRQVYENLSDNYSKKVFLQVIAFRSAPQKYHLSLPQDKFVWEKELARIEGKAVGHDEIDRVLRIGETSIDYKLQKYSLKTNHSDINLFTCSEAIFLNYKDELNQYGYKDVEIKEGDYVIDGGGCIGDTALFFAALAGESGRVFSFEFTPDNVDVFEKNLKLNPDLAKKINLVQRALWSNSKEALFVFDNGPGSSCSLNKFPGYSYKVPTVSIDDFVAENKIAKVDFLKMDIEGAEMEALKGAQCTIKKFKPKLAICLYHKDSDLTDIPQYVKSLVPEYKLYVNHYTQGPYETVLYAKIDEGKIK